MKIFQSLFSTTRSEPDALPVQGKTSSRGPETMPVKMNLEERMEFRRELLFEVIRSTLDDRRIASNSYRFKVMRTDKRGHCYVIMMDMSPAFMASAQAQHKQLAETAALLTQNARTRYGLVVTGMYWRIDETLDVTVAAWARPPGTPAPFAEPAADSAYATLSNIEKYKHATADQLSAFEAKWQKNSDVQLGDRTYSTDLAPLGEDPPRQ
jgi:hypothetical protein